MKWLLHTHCHKRSFPLFPKQAFAKCNIHVINNAALLSICLYICPLVLCTCGHPVYLSGNPLLLCYNLYTSLNTLHYGGNTECTTVNRERFAGLNFLIFHGFQEYHESFSVNISTSLNNRHFWPKKCKNISMKTSVVLKPWTFSSVNLSTSTVSMYWFWHSPSDITLLYKSKGQKDHMNTFKSALKSVLCNQYQNDCCLITCSTGILHWTSDLLQLYYHS